ncbi:hypothetical protein BCR39DRAFT_470528, partial [Naematelia encephala]
FSLGCMLVQPIIDSFFGGVLAMQVISYFTYQRKDRLWTKTVVGVVAFINLCITCYIWASHFSTYFSAYLFVLNFGRFSPFAETGKLAWFPLLDSINSAVVQSFFAYRAYRLCNNNIVIPIIIMALILTSFGATVAVRVIFASLASLFEASKVKVPELIWLSSIMCADIIITVCILYGLWQSKTGWTHTDKATKRTTTETYQAISKLIRMTLESQVPPTIVAITFMAEFVHTPSSLFGSTLQGIQPKFYAMGLMYALNSRISFQQRFVGDGDRSGVSLTCAHFSIAGLTVSGSRPCLPYEPPR